MMFFQAKLYNNKHSIMFFQYMMTMTHLTKYDAMKKDNLCQNVIFRWTFDTPLQFSYICHHGVTYRHNLLSKCKFCRFSSL